MPLSERRNQRGRRPPTTRRAGRADREPTTARMLPLSITGRSSSCAGDPGFEDSFQPLGLLEIRWPAIFAGSYDLHEAPTGLFTLTCRRNEGDDPDCALTKRNSRPCSKGRRVVSATGWHRSVFSAKRKPPCYLRRPARLCLCSWARRRSDAEGRMWTLVRLPALFPKRAT